MCSSDLTSGGGDEGVEGLYYYNGYVYVSLYDGGSDYLAKVSAENCTKVASTSTDTSRGWSAPLLDTENEWVWTIGEDNKVHCFYMENLTERCSTSALNGTHNGGYAGPILVNDSYTGGYRIIVTNHGAYTYSIYENCTIEWEHKPVFTSYETSSHEAYKDGIYVYGEGHYSGDPWDSHCIGLNVSDGSTIWIYNTTSDHGCSPTISDDDLVFSGRWDGSQAHYYILNLTNGNLIFENTMNGFSCFKPIYTAGGIYHGSVASQGSKMRRIMVGNGTLVNWTMFGGDYDKHQYVENGIKVYGPFSSYGGDTTPPTFSNWQQNPPDLNSCLLYTSPSPRD